jgi:hypothetical protein
MLSAIMVSLGAVVLALALMSVIAVTVAYLTGGNV